MNKYALPIKLSNVAWVFGLKTGECLRDHALFVGLYEGEERKDQVGFRAVDFYVKSFIDLIDELGLSGRDREYVRATFVRACRSGAKNAKIRAEELQRERARLLNGNHSH